MAKGAAIGAVAGSFIVEHERQVAKEGIITSSGIFYPIYERHDLGIALGDIPQGLDILYRESGVPSVQVQSHIEEDLRTMTWVAWKNNNAAQIVHRIAREGVAFMFADVGISRLDPINAEQFGVAVQSEQLLGFAALSAVASALAMSKNRVDRRKVLGLGLGAGTWLAAPGVAESVGEKSFEQQNKAIKRLGARLDGLTQDIHPELLLSFFRSALMADKLLTVAEHQQAQQDRKPKIGYWVGLAHSSIEDFLAAGHDICRQVILAYPRSFLLELAEANGGIHNLSSALLFQLRSNISQADIQDANTKIVKSSTIIIDTFLEKGLETRLRE